MIARPQYQYPSPNALHKDDSIFGLKMQDTFTIKRTESMFGNPNTAKG